MPFNPYQDWKAKSQGYEKLKEEKDKSQDNTDRQKTDGQCEDKDKKK
jgi:hypothetical protein